jgi:tetratricopeptide (TPR) repeat protein
MNKPALRIAAALSFLGLIAVWTGCQDTYTTSAKVYMQQSNYEKAVEQCQLAVAQFPDNFEAYFVMGQAYGAKGMYREMNEAFTKSLSINPAHAVDIENYRGKYYADIFNLGVSRIKEGKLPEAAAQFQLASEILPHRTDAYKNLSYTYMQQEKDSLAIETYRRALTVDSTDMDIQASLGLLYYRGKNYEKCISTMDRVLAKSLPSSKQYKDALTYTAFSWDLLGKNDKAIETYQKALDQSPNDTDLLYNMGRLYILQSNYEKALEYFTRVIATNPDDFEANMMVGTANLQLKKYTEAIPFLEKATQVKPDNSQAWTNLAAAYGNMKMKAKSEEAFKTAEALRKEGK